MVSVVSTHILQKHPSPAYNLKKRWQFGRFSADPKRLALVCIGINLVRGSPAASYCQLLAEGIRRHLTGNGLHFQEKRHLPLAEEYNTARDKAASESVEL